MRQSENLPEASTRKFTGFYNPEYKKKCTVYIGTVLSLRNLVGVQEEKYRNAGRNCLVSIRIPIVTIYSHRFYIHTTIPKSMVGTFLTQFILYPPPFLENLGLSIGQEFSI